MNLEYLPGRRGGGVGVASLPSRHADRHRLAYDDDPDGRARLGRRRIERGGPPREPVSMLVPRVSAPPPAPAGGRTRPTRPFGDKIRGARGGGIRGYFGHGLVGCRCRRGTAEHVPGYGATCGFSRGRETLRYCPHGPERERSARRGVCPRQGSSTARATPITRRSSTRLGRRGRAWRTAPPRTAPLTEARTRSWTPPSLASVSERIRGQAIATRSHQRSPDFTTLASQPMPADDRPVAGRRAEPPLLPVSLCANLSTSSTGRS